RSSWALGRGEFAKLHRLPRTRQRRPLPPVFAATSCAPARRARNRWPRNTIGGVHGRRGGSMRSFQKLAGCFAAVLAACASTPPPTPTPQPAPAATPAPAPAPPPPQETPPAETRPTVAPVIIYFDFDSSTISDEGRSKLQSRP